MKHHPNQRGLIVPPLLLILAALTVLGITFMTVVRFQGAQTVVIKDTITAGYVAEIGFKEIQAELAKHGGDWTQVKNGDIVTACGVADPDKLRCQHTPVSSNKTNFHRVYENPLDTTSKVVGMYEAKIETGERRTVFGNKTVTGSSTGYLPTPLVAADKIGYDYQGNKLCDIDVDGCPSRYLGIQVNAFLTDAAGNPNGRSQTIYGVIEIGGGTNGEAPSGFLLDSNKAVRILSNTEYYNPNGFSGPPTGDPFRTIGGLFGPVHSNVQFIFKWYASNETVTRGNPPNSLDPVTLNATSPQNLRWAPQLQILQVDRGHKTTGVTTYDQFAGSPPPPPFDYVYAPPGVFWSVNWAGAGPEPPAGSNFMITDGNGSANPYPCYHSGLNSTDICYSPYGIQSANFGATTYNPGTSFSAQSTSYIDWGPPPGASEPAVGNTYRVQYVDHKVTRIFEKMSYGGSAPAFEYTHNHPTEGGYPLYQLDHSHTGIMGANLSTQSAWHVRSVLEAGWSTDWLHTHPFAASPLSNTNYLDFEQAGFQPTSGKVYPSPLLKAISPDPGFANYKQQLEQLNKYLQLTIGYAMPRNPDGTLNDTSIPTTSNYDMGYIVGNAALTPPNVSLVDFRAVYFGNDLKYNIGADAGSDVLPAGSAISDEAFIWVNDNRNSSTYMRVAKTQISSDYHKYKYKQIPPTELILVRDAAVFIGNYNPVSPIVSCSSHKADCKDNWGDADPIGESTIIDGKLAIVSFSTYPTASGTANEYNKGDIVVTGNIVYRNEVGFDDTTPNLMRQMDPHPSGGATRSLTVNPLSTALTSILNTQAPVSNTDLGNGQHMWVTNTDGTLNRDAGGNLIGRHNGLGLFATNDIKISVTPLFYDQTTEDTNPYHKDTLYIHGQLVAGNRIYVHARDNTTAAPFDPYNNASWPTFLNSSVDKLIMVGSMYSYDDTNLSTYFETNRQFYYDKSLYINPLIGAPYYPESAGDYRNQLIYNNFPRLVPGTWTQEKIPTP